ncbi:hypothetical protein ID866_337 [Astraeus odoratus]|nr:hypothetical protein ID866_337 [Astraeus odoratus]
MDEGSNSLIEDLGSADQSNLFPYIDRDNVHGLNLEIPENAKGVIKPWSDREDTTLFADSGVDDQVRQGFTSPINATYHARPTVEATDAIPRNLRTLLGRGEATPRHLRIYANYPNIIDFADAENTKPHLNISLLEGETSAVEYPLRAAAFRSVHSLSLYFRDSVGGEQSRVYFIGFKGDCPSWRKEATKKLEVPASNATDAPIVDKVQQKVGGQQATAR